MAPTITGVENSRMASAETHHTLGCRGAFAKPRPGHDQQRRERPPEPQQRLIHPPSIVVRSR